MSRSITDFIEEILKDVNDLGRGNISKKTAREQNIV